MTFSFDTSQVGKTILNQDGAPIGEVNSSGLVVDGLTIGDQRVSPVGAFKNKIINGGFDIWRRGTTQSANGYGSADRFYIWRVGPTLTMSRYVVPLGNSFFSEFGARTAALFVVGAPVNAQTDIAQAGQRIEDVRTFAGQRVSLQFVASADAALNIGVLLEQNFGAGGSASVYTHAGVAPVTTAPRLYSFTFDVPNLAGKSLGAGGGYLEVRLVFSAGSNESFAGIGRQQGSFVVTNIQIEEGPYATPFEQRPIGIETLLSQRYYFADENISLEGRAYDAATGFNVIYTFPVTMRVPPACTATKTGGGADITVSIAPSSTTSRHTTVKATRTGSDQVYGTCSITADAEL